MSSRERALKALRLEPTDRIPHKEGLTCPDFETKLTGIDAVHYPFSARLKTLELLDIDMDLTPRRDAATTVQFVEGEGVTTDEDGQTKVRWGAGTTWDWTHGSLFSSIEEVLRFDPEEHFLHKGAGPQFEDIEEIQSLLTLSVSAMAARLQAEHNRVQTAVGEHAEVPGFYYRTLFMWPLMMFGWEKFAELALEYPEDCRRVMSGFAQVSRKVCAAFAQTGIRVLMCHDDLCGARGPLFSPAWYRRYVYGLYEQIWAPLKRKGIKILYVSDGNLDAVVDDVIAAGADGVLAEPATDLAAFAEKYGQTAIIVGNVDSRVLSLGSRDDIRAEVDRVTAFGKECPGFFYGVTNAITWNTPVENVRYYFDYCAEAGRR